MVEHKVDCPQCHTALRSGKPIPAGMKLKCPRCGMLFSAPHGTTNGPHNGALAGAAVAGAAAHAVRTTSTPPAPVPSSALTAAPPAHALGVQSAPAAAAPMAAPAQPPSQAKVLALVAGGGLLLLVTAVVLVIVCFSGGATPPPTAADSDDGLPLARVVKKKPPPPPLVSLPPEEQKKVDAAVQRAAEFLKKQQLPNGSYRGGPPNDPLGVTCMAGLTLLEAGLKASEPAVGKAAEFVRQVAPTYHAHYETYDLSLAILFLDRLGDARDKALIQKLTLRLVAAQTPQGGWPYACPQLSDLEHSQLYTALRELQKKKSPEEVIRGLGGHVNLSPRVRNLAVLRPDLPEEKLHRDFYRMGGDNSNTQFAILALWAARKHDVPLDRSLILIHKRFRASQNPDGSWNYDGHRDANPARLPTMTCAGLLGLAVGFGLDHAPGKRPDEDAAVKKGLERLSKNVGQPDAQVARPSLSQLYFLWSVERVAVLYQLKTIHEKKWYHWGVQMLTTNQHPDGHWRGAPIYGSTDVVDTCFAILFLQRVNLAKDLTDKLLELRAAPAVAAQNPARKD